MQAKLHRWAGEDPSRCIGDLFNLVYDPAFLVHALARVAANAGAKTAGIDGMTVAQIKAREGGDLEFLARLRDSLKSGEYRPARAMMHSAWNLQTRLRIDLAIQIGSAIEPGPHAHAHVTADRRPGASPGML